MTVLHWDESPLGKNHDRKTFDCGDGDPDIYLQRHARQNHESGGAKCFVATPRETPARILGFYTLSPASIEFERVPAIATRGLGRYDVPVYRLGRLAVDRSVQGRGLGGRLLLRAAERCMLVAQQAGGVALLIDAQNEAVAEWYRTYDAVQLNDAPLSLVLPFMVAAKALEQNNLTLPRRRFRSAGIESGEVVSDAHEGIKAAVSKVFRAAAKRSPRPPRPSGARWWTSCGPRCPSWRA